MQQLQNIRMQNSDMAKSLAHIHVCAVNGIH
jgi:hypothetical protein